MIINSAKKGGVFRFLNIENAQKIYLNDDILFTSKCLIKLAPSALINKHALIRCKRLLLTI